MSDVLTFTANCTEVTYLRQSDPQLGDLIELIGDYTLQLRTDYFSALIRSIIGQQLSVLVARSIWNRILNLYSSIEPEKVMETPQEILRSAGISGTKIAYIKDLSSRIIEGSLQLERLNTLDDEEVISQLTRVKGIGTWTAEMFLIFSLGRPNVLSFKDAGLQRAARLLYGLKTAPTLSEWEALKLKWQPYCSAASLYLWRALDLGILHERT